MGEERREAGVLEKERERAMCDGGRDGEWRKSRGGMWEKRGEVGVMEKERERAMYNGGRELVQ